MPEAPSNLDDATKPGEDQVWLPREPGDVQAKAEPHSVYEPPNRKFRIRVLGTDLAHVVGAPFWREIIGHTAKSKGRSEISFRRFPSTMMLTRFAGSSAANFPKPTISSGSAKW